MPVSASKRIREASDQQWQRKSVDEVTLDLPFPISVNRLHRRLPRTVVKTARYARWCAAAGTILGIQKPGKIEGRYTAELLLGRGPRGDADNYGKGVFDLLQDHGVIKNDSLAESVEIKWSDEISGCRVTVRRVA